MEAAPAERAIVAVRLRVPSPRLAEVQAFMVRFAWKGHITKFWATTRRRVRKKRTAAGHRPIAATKSEQAQAWNKT